jgi:hypothetical protein
MQKNKKLPFCPMLSGIRQNSGLSEGFQASPACPSEKNSIKIKMKVEN